ncbi:MAG TPA: hypothetical protein VD973_28100, partial [Symbiobacteriaceae bacterium]|nr:hypothetical protein [Symbiobacteriaceae bacterium]
DAPIEFRVLSGSGQIRQRTLEAGDGGTITVQASLGSLTAVASATPVSGLAISPETFQANKGGTVQLSATALSGGQRVQVQPTWRVQSGPATVSAQGLVTVNDYGAVVVTATLGNLTATATGQAVGKVTITSKPEYVVPGLSYNLTASATDSTGRAIDVPITWTAVGATIDRTTGRLTNVTGNQVKVVAMAAGISEEITIPVIKSISITPVTAHVMVGKTVKFTAKGVDAGGKQYPVEVRWDRTVPTVGIIDASGALAGINSGTTDVVAELGSLRGYATVRVAGDPNRLTVSAPNASLPIGTGATTEITVKLVDAAGNHSPVNDFPISFVLTDTTKGTLNRTLVLSQQGEAKVTFTAGNTAGPVTIAVSAPGTTMSAQAVSLNLYQPTPSHIQLTATPQPLAAGNGIATISATLRDVNNNPVLATQNLTVNLSATSGMLGWLTSNSVVIQTGQSSASTSFISGNTAGTIQINGTNSIYQVRGVTVTTAVAGAAAKVKIRPIPGDTPVTGLSSLQVQVEVLDSNGVLRANDSTSQVELKVKFPEGAQMVLPQTYTAAASGGIATFQVPAYVVGTAELTASLVGVSTEGSTDTTTAQFVPGVFSNLRLTAQPASLPADGYSTSQIVAEVIDRSGAVLTTVNPVVTFYKLVNGNVTTALTDTKVQAVGGKAVLTVQSGRLTGTDTWYATAPGLVTENLATVTTTATSGDAYTLRVQGSTSFSVGTATTMTVQVVDQMGRVVTSDNGRPVTVTHSLPGVSISPASAVTQNGVATFVVLGTQAVSGTFTLSTTGMLQPVVSSAISFGGGGSSTAYSLFASSSAASARTGSSVTVWVRVMDSQGSVVATDSGRLISASVTGSATVNPTSTTTSNGLASFTVTGNGVGNVVLTFTATGLQQPSSTLVISFTN